MGRLHGHLHLNPNSISQYLSGSNSFSFGKDTGALRHSIRLRSLCILTWGEPHAISPIFYFALSRAVDSKFRTYSSPALPSAGLRAHLRRRSTRVRQSIGRDLRNATGVKVQ